MNNPGKSPGPDRSHPKVMKECAKSLAEPLTIIINKLFEEGRVPVDWREANIIPIYNKRSKKSPSNYRPVSFPSVTCKLMEKVTRERIMKHSQSYQMFTDKKYGFRNKKMCHATMVTSNGSVDGDYRQ